MLIITFLGWVAVYTFSKEFCLQAWTSYYLSPAKCVKKTPHPPIPTLTSSTQGIIQNSTQDHIQFKAKYLH